MKLFRKQIGAALGNTYYLLIRDKWAKKMGSLTLGLSRNKLTFLLAGFIIVSSSLIILIVCKGLRNEALQNLNAASIAKVINTTQKFKNKVLKPFPISKAEYKRIISFKNYMDSLREDTSGKRTYDSIRVFRPGLLDSLDFIENYYTSNVKE
jgi:hypothetical protein